MGFGGEYQILRKGSVAETREAGEGRVEEERPLLAPIPESILAKPLAESVTRIDDFFPSWLARA